MESQITGQLPEWEVRLLEERKQLWERAVKLSTFMQSSNFATLHVVDQSLLREQYQHMSRYYGVLRQRCQRARMARGGNNSGSSNESNSDGNDD